MPDLKYASLVLVSRNKDKHREFCNLLGLADLKFSSIVVTEPQSLSLHWVVEQKIDTVKQQLPGVPFFVEHTGLIIDAWKGLPGGLTQVFMDTVGNDGICKMMRAYGRKDRGARGQVVIGFYHQSTGRRLFEGEVMGCIAPAPRGDANFGWDPIFVPNGDERTYAEMSLMDKNVTSMRRLAVDRFARFLSQHFVL